jgi:hypothetical protein
MLIKLGVPLLCVLLFIADGCSSGSNGGQQPAQSNTGQQQTNAVQQSAASANNSAQPQPSASAQTTNACALIQNSEIEAIQGAKVTGLQPSTRAGGDFNISQCYYTVVSADGTKNLSVHLEVTEGSGRASVKEFWEERFGGAEREEKGERERKEGKKEGEKGKGGEEEEESTPPLRVKGVGDEAFWVGSLKAGALYVLKGERMVRVSVGGGDDVNTKIDKSKKLAAAVLKRLT